MAIECSWWLFPAAFFSRTFMPIMPIVNLIFDICELVFKI